MINKNIPIKTFYEGTAIKFTVSLNIETATSVTITIDDPAETTKVSNATMTKDADGIYSYVYQTDENNDEGQWIATIKVTYGGYTSVDQILFNLVEQE